MAKKKITEKQKLRDIIVELRSQLEDEKERKQYYMGKYEAVNEDKEKIEGNWQRRRDNDHDEIRFLRSLVELITIPADKLERLDELKKRDMGRPY